MIARDHLRLEAWVAFQNPYLERFEKPADGEAADTSSADSGRATARDEPGRRPPSAEVSGAYAAN